MITPSQIYWLTRLDGIKELLTETTSFGHFIVGCLLALAALVTIHIVFASNGSIDWYHGRTVDEMEKAKDKWRVVRKQLLKYCLPITFAVLIVSKTVNTFIPTIKEAAAIYVIPMIANSEAAQQLPDVATEFVVLAKDWLKELRPQNDPCKEPKEK